jgi:hypothetical protein
MRLISQRHDRSARQTDETAGTTRDGALNLYGNQRGMGLVEYLIGIALIAVVVMSVSDTTQTGAKQIALALINKIVVVVGSVTGGF